MLRNDELHNTDTTATTAKPPCPGSGRTSGRRIGILNRIRWAAGDKEDLGRGLDKLHFTVNTLYSFATSEAERARNDFRLRTHALRTLDLAVTMDPAQYPGIAKAARVKQLLQASLSNPPVRSPPLVQSTSLFSPSIAMIGSPRSHGWYPCFDPPNSCWLHSVA